ncbi:hypothetical protein SBV1_270042 [Verrucomicrobia bacterium]|nr:hypothetical protein SBV1_270042 [Verrucomicrobiota bacterium]
MPKPGAGGWMAAGSSGTIEEFIGQRRGGAGSSGTIEEFIGQRRGGDVSSPPFRFMVPMHAQKRNWASPKMPSPRIRPPFPFLACRK